LNKSDDAPELTKDWFAKVELQKGAKALPHMVDFGPAASGGKRGKI
jgi:hypothetical protein